MKKLFILSCVLGLTSVCSISPIRAPFVPPLGAVSVISAPLDIDYQDTQIGRRKGSASAFNIPGRVSVGDVSLKSAAEKDRIKTVKAADDDDTSVLYIFRKTTLNVYGD
jgi:hypothetical protein